MEDLFPSQWNEVASEIIANEASLTILLGEVDTGKTTFITHSARMAIRSNKVVGIVDADVGQQDIGVPTTIGLGIVKRPFESLKSIDHSGLYFVGSTSPEGHLLPMILGTQKMVKKARDLGAQIIFVDTTGLVHGKIGRALKYYKIQGILPNNIVALQRNDEIEHLLRPFEGLMDLKIYRLPVPDGLVRRNHIIRQANREEGFRSFFKTIHYLNIPFSDIKTSNIPFLSGRPLSQNELRRLSKTLDEIVIYGERLPEGLYLVLVDPPSKRLSQIRERMSIFHVAEFKNLLVGLADKDCQILSLGIIEGIDFIKGIITIKTPYPFRESIKTIQFSEFRLEL